MQQWNDIQIADGYSWDDNLQLPDQDFQIFNIWKNSLLGPVDTFSFRGSDHQSVKENAASVIFNYRFDRWSIKNHLKVSDKSLTLVEPIYPQLIPYSPDDNRLNYELQSGLFGDPISRLLFLGEAEYYDLETGEVLAKTQTEGGFNNISILENNLPSETLFYYMLNHDRFTIREWSDRLTTNIFLASHAIRIENTFRVLDYLFQRNSSGLLLTNEIQPRVLGLRVNTGDFSTTVPEYAYLSNQMAQLTNPSGVLSFNNGLSKQEEIYEISNALAVSDRFEWDNWVFEADLRYEMLWHRVNRIDRYFTSSDFLEYNTNDQLGSLDGDELTVYDNVFDYPSGTSTDINTRYQLFSYHAAMSYQPRYNQLLYLNVNSNQQLMTTRHYFYYGDRTADELPTLDPRQVNQAEVGYRFSNRDVQIVSTAFVNQHQNILSHLRTISFPDNRPTIREYVYNNYLNYGLETSARLSVLPHWTLSGHFTLMQQERIEEDEESIIIQPWSIQPISIINELEFYDQGLNIFLTYNRLGKRFANENQAFELPAFQTFDLGLMWNIRALQMQLGLEATNIFNTVGIFSFDGLTSQPLPDNLFTAAVVEANPDEVFKVRRNLPRAIYFTVQYDFNNNF